MYFYSIYYFYFKDNNLKELNNMY